MPRQKGSASYSSLHVEQLLDIIDEVKPIGKNHWETVAMRYNRIAVARMWPERDLESLKGTSLLLRKVQNAVFSTKADRRPKLPSSCQEGQTNNAKY